MVKDNNVRIMVTLTKEELEMLEKVSQRRGMSKSAIIKVLIQEKFEMWKYLFRV